MTAQGPVTVRDAQGNTVNGQTIAVYAPSTTMEMYKGLQTILGGSADRTINVKRYELNFAPGSTNYFCWGLCYGPQDGGSMPYWLSVDPVMMTPNTPFNGFSAYYRPEGTVGISTYRYVWFALDNPNDSTFVDIVFDTQTVGMAESRNELGVEIYPNPVTSGDITLTFNMAGDRSGLELVIYNVLGERAVVRPLDAVQDRLVIPDGVLRQGIWFVNVERSGKILLTKRLIVGR